MHRSYPNPAPVTNKYLAYKKFLKDQEDHKVNLRNIHGLLDNSSPTPRPHVTQRIRQRQVEEYQFEMVQNENDRLRSRMINNGAFTDSYNDYVSHSLNMKKRHRDETQHRHVIERLRRQIHRTQTNYSTRRAEYDFAKQQEFKRQITRFPPIHK